MTISVHKHIDALGAECFQLRVHDQDASDVSGLVSLSRSAQPRCLGDAGWQEAACDIRATRVQRDGADLVFEIPSRYGYQIDEYATVLVQFQDLNLQENVVWEPVPGAHQFVDVLPPPPPPPPPRSWLWIAAAILFLLFCFLGYYVSSNREATDSDLPEQSLPGPTKPDPVLPGSDGLEPAPLDPEDQDPAPLDPEEQEPVPLNPEDQVPAPLDPEDQDPSPLDPEDQDPDESELQLPPEICCEELPESDRFNEFISLLENNDFDQARQLGEELMVEGDARVMAVFANEASSLDFSEGLFDEPNDTESLRLFTRTCEAGNTDPDGLGQFREDLEIRTDAEADDLVAYLLPRVLEACSNR